MNTLHPVLVYAFFNLTPIKDVLFSAVVSFTNNQLTGIMLCMTLTHEHTGLYSRSDRGIQGWKSHKRLAVFSSDAPLGRVDCPQAPHLCGSRWIVGSLHSRCQKENDPPPCFRSFGPRANRWHCHRRICRAPAGLPEASRGQKGGIWAQARTRKRTHGNYPFDLHAAGGLGAI